jgi:hypothetical protein
MTTNITNGRPRQSLADQIDRLDETLAHLDRLAQALPGAIADAVGHAVSAAATVAGNEPRRKPEVRDGSPASPAKGPPALGRALGAAGRWAGAVLTATVAKRTPVGLPAVGRRVGYALACGAGLALAGYLAAPWLTAALAGFGGTCAALLAQARKPLRLVVRTLTAD